MSAGLQKPRPKLLNKRESRAELAAIDRVENAKVRQRSGGWCEVKTFTRLGFSTAINRCRLRASQVHHLISGIGRRNRGVSIKAEHKLHVCDRCHGEIHGHVLVPVNQMEREAAVTVRYERKK